MTTITTISPEGATTFTMEDDTAPAKPIAAIAWEAAWTAFAPIWEQWDQQFAGADKMPNGPEQDAALSAFFAALPAYQSARSQFMRVPAHDIASLAEKMVIADPADEEHWDICVADAKSLAVARIGGAK